MNAMAFEVAVVGGGPIGAATALGLSRGGFRVALIEKGPPPSPLRDAAYDPRVYAIAPRSARFLQALGVWSAIASDRISPYSSMKVWQQDRQSMLRFESGDVGAAELGWIVEHTLIARALWAQCGDVRVMAGATVKTLRFSDDGAALQLADGQIVEARLIVAADGGESALRRMAGLTVSGWPYAQRAIVSHVTTAAPHRRAALQRFLSTGPLALLPLADGRSSIVWAVEGRLCDELMALDEAAFCARLSTASDQILGQVTGASPRRMVPLALHQAHDYARAGLVLVGDAAHGIHPLTGQGVNLGFGDAQQLIEVLIQARDAGRDWHASRTLARYARARKAANLEMAAMTDLLYRSFRIRAPGLKTALGLGLGIVNELAPLRGFLARRAAGL